MAEAAGHAPPGRPHDVRLAAVSLSGPGLEEAANRAARALDRVSEGYPFTDSLLVHKVCGRIFVVVNENPDDPLVTVKVDPEDADAFVRQHESIGRARYFDKRHWVSVTPGPGITETLVEDLVHDSYDTVVARLPRRDRDGLDRTRRRHGTTG